MQHFTREDLKRSPREYPYHGFAPGNYMILCHDCGETKIGCDKRALRCEECAELRAENGPMRADSELLDAVASLG